MGFIKDKYFFWGILTGVLWTGFGVLILLFFLSNESIEDSLSSLYYQNKLARTGRPLVADLGIPFLCQLSVCQT